MTGDNHNLAAVLEAGARRQGFWDRPAFLVGDATFTHGEVHDGAARAATVLAERGVGPGDRVLLVLPDGVELVWGFLGAARLGAVAVPVNPRLTPDDHRHLAADCRPRVVVCPADLAGRFEGPAGVIEGEGLAAAIEAEPPAPAVILGPDEPAYAQYTSGTTGLPRAAVHRHADPLVYFQAFARPAVGIHADDVVFSVSKLFFAYGLGNSLFFPLLAGCRAVLHPGLPHADVVAGLVERHGVTVLFTVPTSYARLVASDQAQAFTSVRAAVSAGEALVVPLAERARAFLGCPILDGLGSTEVGQTFVSNTLACQRDGTTGRVLPPYEIAVRGESGADLEAGQPGVLWVRGPTVLLEYLGRPDATAAAKDGPWLCTGDRATVDPDGFVHHLGRIDDIEVVGGINVAPLEIEAVLSAHGSCGEVAVAAVRDESGASRLEAFVVPTGDCPPRDIVARDMHALACAHLAPHKIPRAFHLVDALPRTPTGKLRRFMLRSGQWGGAPRT